MKLLKLVPALLLTLSGSLLADEVEQEVEVNVVIADGAPNISTAHVNLSSLADLEVGESRTIENASGRTVTVTRTENGMQVDVDGNTIEVPHIDTQTMTLTAADVDIDHGDMATSVTSSIVGTHAIRAHPPEGVTIVSSMPLDDSVRESIKSVLISAGIDEDVRFVDTSDATRQVHVIKQVETLR